MLIAQNMFVDIIWRSNRWLQKPGGYLVLAGKEGGKNSGGQI